MLTVATLQGQPHGDIRDYGKTKEGTGPAPFLLLQKNMQYSMIWVCREMELLCLTHLSEEFFGRGEVPQGLQPLHHVGLTQGSHFVHIHRAYTLPLLTLVLILDAQK